MHRAKNCLNVRWILSTMSFSMPHNEWQHQTLSLIQTEQKSAHLKPDGHNIFATLFWTCNTAVLTAFLDVRLQSWSKNPLFAALWFISTGHWYQWAVVRCVQLNCEHKSRQSRQQHFYWYAFKQKWWNPLAPFLFMLIKLPGILHLSICHIVWVDNIRSNSLKQPVLPCRR